MELSELKKTSEELNKKLGLIPKINNTEKKEELITQLIVINDFLLVDNYLSDETVEVIRSLKQ